MKRLEPIRDLEKMSRLQERLIEDGKYKECLLWLLLFNCNIRVGDALNLKWDYLLDENNQIVENLVIVEKKTSKKKEIPITQQLSTALLSYYEKYRPRRTNYMFRSKSNRIRGRNQAWTRAYCWKVFNIYARKVGIQHAVGSHTPRKTWAYHAYYEGVDIDMIRRLMNHSSIRQTEVYCGIDADKRRETYEQMSKLNRRGGELFKRLPESYEEEDYKLKTKKKRKR